MLGRTISHYRIVEKLGEGGMGVVYVAEDTVLERRVAIKTLTTARGPVNQHFRMRFLREAQAVSKLSHPHIASIYDYGETEDGEPYIVMELVEGQTLADLIKSGSLTIPRALEIIQQVAEALGEAHRRGLVHRDIKPSNVAINERGNVKVLDFGLAKHVSPAPATADDPAAQALLKTQTREGVIVGTPMYLSPEQALGVEVDARSDLFSLGSVLYECIAGRPAFSGKSDIEICAKVIRDDPPPPSAFNPLVSTELDRLTLKALAKKPEARYQTASQLFSDLDTALTPARDTDQIIDRTIEFSSVGPRRDAPTHLPKLFRRVKPWIPYSVLASLLVAMILIGLWYSRQRPTHEPNAEAKRFYDEGIKALRDGTYYKASKMLVEATRKDDKFALAHARLAEAWNELDYYGKANDEILLANRLVSNRGALPRVHALYLDATTDTVRGDFTSAIQGYLEIAQILERQPSQQETSQAYLDLGRAYEKHEEITQAVNSYTRATQLDTQSAAAFLRLGSLQGRQQNVAAATLSFDRADQLYQTLNNAEGVTEVLYQRASLMQESNRRDDGEAVLKQILTLPQPLLGVHQQIRTLLALSRINALKGEVLTSQQQAQQAITVAQRDGMENLTTQGLLDLGYAFLVRGDNNEAERVFNQALEFAQRDKGQRNQALAQLRLASLRVEQDRPDEALAFVEQATFFYQKGSYRVEIMLAHAIRARAFNRKGDYNTALKEADLLARSAEELSDQRQLVRSHDSKATAFFHLEQYSNALSHYEQSYKLYMDQGNLLYAGHSLINRADMLWRLGQYPKALDSLREALKISERPDGSSKQLMPSIYLVKARLALSQRNLRDAQADALLCLTLIMKDEQDQHTTIEAKRILGLAYVLRGMKKDGRRECEEALRMAERVNDPELIANAQLALAEALLESGDASQALSYALRSQASSATSNRRELEWRALLIAARAASQLNGKNSPETHEYLDWAKTGLRNLQQQWDADTWAGYLSRPEIKLEQQELQRLSNTFP